MTVKTFRAPTIEEAMARVKATVGPAALIMETRMVSPRGLLGFLRKPVVEVVVGVEDPAALPAWPPDHPPALQPSPAVWEEELGNLRKLEEELTELKDSLRLLVEAAPSDLTSPFAGLWRRLVEEGVDGRTADALIAEAKAVQGSGGVVEPREALRAALERHFPTAGEAPRPGSDGARVLAFLGPPGMGKTTLLVKLAGHLVLQGGERVMVASADFFRVGADEQLKTYAEMLRVPFESFSAPEDATPVLEAARAGVRVLVDTPGVASHDRERLAELARRLGAFPAIERHLVVSATAEPLAAVRAIACYREVGFERLALAGVDEARRHGLLLLAAEAAAVPISYLSFGQEVARGLEVAQPGRLAELLLGPPPHPPASAGTH